MKKFLGAVLLVGLMLAGAVESQAQIVDTNMPAPSPVLSGPATQVIDFLTTGSNWMVAPYGIVTTDSKFGGGIAFGYKLSDFVVPTMRLDYLEGQLWMPSASLQLQAPLTIMGKITAIPFTFAGIATPISGAGNNNGSAVGIFGAGAAIRLSSKVDVVGDYEKWSGFKGGQIRFGILYKF
ncbi:MAG TPA: hypothetical protein VLT16_00555 [Candidatus Limnocylindrales bacterium]|nr:hypothetical protein [Candidatus Limnocylindrales bacterium]